MSIANNEPDQPNPTGQPEPRAGGRVLALDLGDRRIGVAVCDGDRRLATPYGTVHRVGDRPAEHRLIADVVAETEAEMIVVGLPLSLDGEVGPAARAVLSEVRGLKRALSIEVVTHDERMTTVTAEDYLAERGIKGQKRRAVVDQVAAAVILQSWIDAASNSDQ